MKFKRLAILILLTNLICAFPAGHAIIFLGLFEPILIAGVISGDNESPTMWILSTILLLIGQILIIFVLVKRTEQRSNQLVIIGILILTLAIISIYYTMHEQMWTITLLTASPFIVLSGLFLMKTINQSLNRDSR